MLRHGALLTGKATVISVGQSTACSSVRGFKLEGLRDSRYGGRCLNVVLKDQIQLRGHTAEVER